MAVVFVVVYHAGIGLPGGFLGVDVFFVISGYVIGRLLLHQVETTSSIQLAGFYARRIRRLLPALAVMLGTVAVAAVVGLGPFGEVRDLTVKTGIAAALYVANFGLIFWGDGGYFGVASTANPLLHTWTLAVEEQFYLFLPPLILVVARSTRRFRRGAVWALPAAIFVIALVSFGVGAVLSGSFGQTVGPIHARGAVAFYSSPTRAWEFLAGVLAVYLEAFARRLNPGAAGVIGSVGLAGVIVSGFVFTEAAATPGPTTLLPVAATVLVIVAGSVGIGRVQRALSARPLVWVGDRSYGWYLWHWPVIVFVRASFPMASDVVLLLAGIGALVPTMISYRWLEQPIRKNPLWRGRRAVRLASVCAAVPILAFVLLALVPTPTGASFTAVQTALQPRPNRGGVCKSSTSGANAKTTSECRWTVPGAKGRVALLGDSHAGVLSGVMRRSSLDNGYDFVLYDRPGCPFSDAILRFDLDLDTASCRKFVTDTTRDVLADPPDLVVLASRQDAYVGESSFVFDDAATGSVARTSAAKARVWRDGLRRTLDTFTSHGIPVVVIATVPQLEPFDLELCPTWRILVNARRCGHTVSMVTVDAERSAGLTATRAAVDSVEGATLVDFTDDVCSSDSCSTYRAGRWIYLDGSHLTSAGAELTEPSVRRSVIPRARGSS